MKRLITMVLVIGISAITGMAYGQISKKAEAAKKEAGSKEVIPAPVPKDTLKSLKVQYVNPGDTGTVTPVPLAEKAAAPVKEEAAKVEKAEEKPTKPKTEPKEVKK